MDAKEVINNSKSMIQEKMALQRQVSRLNRELSETKELNASGGGLSDTIDRAVEEGDAGGVRPEDHVQVVRLLKEDVKEITQLPNERER